MACAAVTLLLLSCIIQIFLLVDVCVSVSDLSSAFETFFVSEFVSVMFPDEF